MTPPTDQPMTSADPAAPQGHAGQGGHHQRDLHLRDYWRVIWHNRLMVAAVFLVVVAVTAAWTLTRTPIYQATSTVEIQTKANNLRMGQDISGMGASNYGWFAEEKYHNTQLEIIKSRDVSERVVNNLGLRSHPRFEAADDPVDAFRKSLMVEPRRDTGLIQISIRGTNPEEITHWSNEVARAFVARNLDHAKNNVESAIDLIDTEVARMRDNVQEVESRRLQALRDSNLIDAENKKELVRQKLLTWHDQLTKIQIEKNEIGESLRQIRLLRADSGDMMTFPVLARDSTLTQLLESQYGLQTRLEEMKVKVRPSHPDYQALDQQISKNQIAIDARVELIFNSLKNDFEKLQGQEEYLVGEIDQAESFSMAVAQASSGYDTIAREAETQKKVFELMSRALNEVVVGVNLMTNNVTVLDEATVPRWPIAPRKKLNLVIGGIFGLMLGVAAAFFRDYLDNTFRTPEDIEKYLGLSVLGVIPKFEEGDPASQRAVKEAYQSLRTSVIFSSKNRTRKVVLVTSTGPQEGKSSTVANLGRTLSQAGERVVVLDCDLRRPTQHLHHDHDRDHGLTNYLVAREGESDWSQFLKRDPDTGLEMMTCGPIPPSPAELLGSERFKGLIEEMRGEYDWILIDSPPSSSLADSTLLAAESDMVIAVVRHNKTDRDIVRKALQRVRNTGAHFAGAVLNNVDINRAHDKDYYYASYYYYGADEENENRTVRKKKKVAAKSKQSVG